MPDIKTRDTLKGTIKTIDKSAVAAERMKSAFIQTKEKAEHSVSVPESSAEEYASNRLESGIDRVSHDAIHQFDKQGRKGVKETKQNIAKAKDGIQKFKEKRAAQSLQKQTTGTVRNKSIKAAERTQKTVKETARSAGKKTIKTVGKGSAKTAQKTVKTAERTAKTTVKTAQRTAKAAQKTAQATVKASQRAVQAARAAARAAVITAKAIAKAIALAVKAISCFGHYCDLPDRYASRISVRYLFLRRGFRHGYEYADRCAGNQYRIQYQTARGEKLGIL